MAGCRIGLGGPARGLYALSLSLAPIPTPTGALPECLTDGTDVVGELEQQELRILQEVLK